jgi:tetratricopeptide (TPR) repeat protein
LLIAILRRLEFRGALLAGFLFALHPVCVESVAWISEQKNTLSLVFYLASALVYLRFDRERRPRRYVLATLLFIFAVLTKTVTATLPAALLVIFWWKRGRLSWRTDVMPLLPWLVLGGLAAATTVWVENAFVGARGATYDLSFLERCLLAGRIVWFYLGKLLWPADLMFIYPRWAVKTAAADWWPYSAALLAATGVLFHLRHRSRGPLAAWLFFIGSLFPALGFFNVYPFAFSYVADHFQYLAMLGITTGLAGGAMWFSDQLRGRAGRVAAPLCALAALGALGFASAKETRKYSSEETLYRSTLQQNPDCFLAHNNLGTLLRVAGNRAEAIEHYREALRAQPEYLDALANLASMLSQEGLLDEAIELYRRALRFEQSATLHVGLGAALVRAGRWGEAVGEFEEALRLEPESLATRDLLGKALMSAGRPEEAVLQFREELRGAPNAAGVHTNLGQALAQSRRFAEALASYEEALRLDPALAMAHMNLAVLLPQFNRMAAAVDHMKAAVRLSADLPNAHALLGDLLMMAEQPAEAADVYATAVRSAPGDPVVRESLGVSLLLSGRGPDAVVELREAIRLNPESPSAHHNLSLALEAVGRSEEAARELQRGEQLRRGGAGTEPGSGRR